MLMISRIMANSIGSVFAGLLFSRGMKTDQTLLICAAALIAVFIAINIATMHPTTRKQSFEKHKEPEFLK